jgi:3-oxoacyl-[acyl-carrier-protein] synthase-3
MKHIPLEKFFLNLEHYGNTSAASIPIAMDEYMEKNPLLKGQKIMFIGFGAGLTWGGALLTI